MAAPACQQLQAVRLTVPIVDMFGSIIGGAVQQVSKNGNHFCPGLF
jgi:hypothetical protein